MKFTQIPETTFQELQLNAGVLLRTFDPTTAKVERASIVGATSGGVSFNAKPSFSDYGEDIDNCPKNMKELKKLDTWDIKLTGTYITVNADNVKSLLAAADIGSDNSTEIVPRNELADEDFTDLWWVGDYSDVNDEANGGFVAVHMMNNLSTGGLSIKSGDKSKGQFAFEYTAHYSIKSPDTVPFAVYVKAGA